ncbi:Origin recognition complex subunit 2 [Boothiomyces sp. JEL0838]|nr:Origin recognition complex subunit 2 [Boothiomyces sp. JEL0838]
MTLSTRKTNTPRKNSPLKKKTGRSTKADTPQKKVLKTGLDVSSRIEAEQNSSDDEYIDKENLPVNSPAGKEMFTLTKKHSSLEKFITPFKERQLKLQENKENLKNVVDIESSEDDEDYFANASSKTKTSNNTLSFSMTLADYNLKVNNTHVDNKQLLDQRRSDFFQFRFTLQQGFSLLFYGYGSKYNMMNEFVTKYLEEGPVVNINGFHPNISLKPVLSKIISDVIKYDGTMGSIQNMAEIIINHFSDKECDYPYLTIVAHNIEGPGLQNEQSQRILSQLAACKSIYFIASFDNINTPLLWDNTKLSNFNFIWHDLTTFEPYLIETSFETNILGKNKTNSFQGTKYVLDSLTSNAKQIFLLLAEHQLSVMESKASSNDGLSFQTFYQRANESFLCTSQLTFKTLLTEFKDHEIISSVTNSDGQISQFQGQIDYFSKSYNILAYDYVGHGDSKLSTEPSDYDIFSLSRDLHEVLKLTEEYTKILFVCHSYGTLLTNLMLHEFGTKEKYAGLVLIGPKDIITKKEHEQTRVITYLPLFVLDILRFFDRWGGIKSASIGRILGPYASLDMKNKQLKFNLHTPTTAIKHMVGGMRALDQSIYSHSVPTMIIGGQYDQLTPPKNTENVAEWLRVDESNVKWYPTGHMVMMEQEANVNADIESFANKLLK